MTFEVKLNYFFEEQNVVFMYAIISSIFPTSAWTFQLNKWCTHSISQQKIINFILSMHIYNARSKLSFHKNICIYQYLNLQVCETTNSETNTKVAFISRIFMVMGKPEMDYGYCSCKHSEKNIPSCLLCRVYTVHQRDDYCGDSRYQPV